MEQIAVMTKKDGHKTINFDPEEEAEVRRVRREIKDLLGKGYYAYYFDTEKQRYNTLQPKDLKNITDKKINEFILAKPKKKVVAIPETGG